MPSTSKQEGGRGSNKYSYHQLQQDDRQASYPYLAGDLEAAEKLHRPELGRVVKYSKGIFDLQETRESFTDVSISLERGSSDRAEYSDYSYEKSDIHSWMRRNRVILLLGSVVVVLAILLTGALLGRSSEATVSYVPVEDIVESIREDLDTENVQGVSDSLSLLRQEGWMPFDSSLSSPHVPAARPLKMLDSQKSMPYYCAEAWIARGEICEYIAKGKVKLRPSELDVVWTWVTANPHWTGWRERLSQGAHRLARRWLIPQPDLQELQERMMGPKASKNAKDKHFRSHDQLLYSVRSVLANLPFIKKLHLLVNDLPACEPSNLLCSNTMAQRVGQVPHWLDTNVTTAVSRRGDFNLQFHWDLFKADDHDPIAWRARSLPTFDSLAIESQLANVREPAENVFYMNDDLYILRNLSHADFASPLFGPVLRIQKDLRVSGEAPGTSKLKSDGEWPGMTHSNWLLDRRFGQKKRSYLVHQGKVMNTPLLEEVASIWAEELKSTAEVRFRGRSPELNMLFLSTYYIIEKHREALLWSYFVAKMDSQGTGEYSTIDRANLVASLGTVVEEEDPKKEGELRKRLHVSRPSRVSYGGAAAGEVLKSASLDPPTETEYRFSSQNGYAFVPLGQPDSTWPDFNTTDPPPSHGKPETACTIDIEECFTSKDFAEPGFTGLMRHSQQLFKRMAYEKPECGDCAIVAILGQQKGNGDDTPGKGLDAFLPGSGSYSAFDSDEQMMSVPPLLGAYSNDWTKTDFSLKAVLGDSRWSPREYSVRLLQRYSYTIGDTPNRFISLRSPVETVRLLKELERSLDEPNGPALIALNDDIIKSAYVESVDANLKRWHEKIWPQKSKYEL